MTKLTFEELCNAMWAFNKAHNDGDDGHVLPGYIVISQDSFNKAYSIESRTYAVSNSAKYFRNACGNSLFASALDGSDPCVRLDWYLGRWSIEYCYLGEEYIKA